MLAAARAARSLAAAAGVVLLAASCGAAGHHSSVSRSPAGRTGAAWFADKGAVAQLLSAARREIAATSSYDYRRLDRFRKAIRSSTTGPLTRTLTGNVDSTIARTGTAMRVVQRATVDEIGVGTMSPDGAVTVLAVGVVAVHNTKYPHGHVEPFDVVATLRHAGGRWLLAALDSHGSIDGDPPGTPGLAAAAAAARSGLQALLSFRRASFASDFARALAATTGALRSQVAGQRSATLRALQKGGFDLGAKMRALAVESAGGGTVDVLAELDGFRIVAGRTAPSAGRSLHATLVRRGGHWLLSDVRSVHPVS